MFSVTKRIGTVSQPKGGYVSPSLFHVVEYDDGIMLPEIIPAFRATVGMAVDYLTRFMMGSKKEEAFEISLEGARKIDQFDTAYTTLQKITGCDDTSIQAACHLVVYDAVIRAGAKEADPQDVPEEIVNAIRILIGRCMTFWKSYGPVVLNGFTFEGGYTTMVDSGDGDYLTADTLWDFKVTKKEPTPQYTLQLAMYYLMGYFSEHEEFKSVTKLGLFNPEKNKVYVMNVADIPEESLTDIARDVIGYNVVYGGTWKDAWGSNDKMVAIYLSEHFKDTGFRPENYEDGIHDITTDDYWSFYRKINPYKLKPTFSKIHSIKFLKKDGFIMFVSVSKYGSVCSLYGASQRRLTGNLEYYYENLPNYGNAVLGRFSPYWDALYQISNQLKGLKSDVKYLETVAYPKDVKQREKKGLDPLDLETFISWNFGPPEGKVHGCIVDLSYFDHIYVNPFDGTIASYHADSMYDKRVYKNTEALLKAQRPDLLSDFKAHKKTGSPLLLCDKDETNHLAELQPEEEELYSAHVYDTDMYKVSNRLKELQTVYDHHLISRWEPAIYPACPIDDFAPENRRHECVSGRDRKPATVGERRVAPIKQYWHPMVGETAVMYCGLKATITNYKSACDVTVQYEDGTVVEHVIRKQFEKGIVPHPGFELPPKPPKKKTRKLTPAEKTEIVQYCIDHDLDFSGTAAKFEVTYGQVYGRVQKYLRKKRDI